MIFAIGVFAVKSISSGRSAFYTISACAGTTILVMQTILNVFGSVDLLPLTGVTFPFVSVGGTSLMGGSGSIVIPHSNSSAIVIPQACVSEVQNKKFVYTLGKDNKVNYTEIQVAPQNDGKNYVVTDGLKVGDKYVTNGITKLSDQMEIVPITPERYQQKIQEQAKAMSAGDIVGAMKK